MRGSQGLLALMQLRWGRAVGEPALSRLGVSASSASPSLLPHLLSEEWGEGKRDERSNVDETRNENIVRIKRNEEGVFREMNALIHGPLSAGGGRGMASMSDHQEVATHASDRQDEFSRGGGNENGCVDDEGANRGDRIGSENTLAGTLNTEYSATDPFALAKEEVACVTNRLRQCILTDIPVLEKAAEYFFQSGKEGKRLRSTVVMLMATGLAPSGPGPDDLFVDDSPASQPPVRLRRRQQRLAEIAELIHVASLLHDDVIDNSDSRRGLKALNTLFGNKVAILAGDFLLARASVSLASLQNSEVIALMSQVLEHLVSGEILQMSTSEEDSLSMDHYMEKTFFKTASLLANSCKSVGVLAGCTPSESLAAWNYGKHLGIAFQLVDDILDFTSSQEELGKPVGSDMRAGLATAPVLFAAREDPNLIPLIRRKFRKDGDIEHALNIISKTSGIENAKALARHHAEKAVAALQHLPPVQGQDGATGRAALEAMSHRVVERTM